MRWRRFRWLGLGDIKQWHIGAQATRGASIPPRGPGGCVYLCGAVFVAEAWTKGEARSTRREFRSATAAKGHVERWLLKRDPSVVVYGADGGVMR